MWKIHFETLYHSVSNNTCESYVKTSLQQIDIESRDSGVNCDTVQSILNKLKSGKSCGPDGLPAENFKDANKKLSVLLAMCYNSMLTHGHLPVDCIETTLVPIIKDKAGDISDKSNYRPIALATVCSKILEKCLLTKIEEYLYTCENQFGFKKNHGTDSCIFSLKQIVHYYKRLSSPLFICYLDASKAFDKVNQWVLFKKLIDRKVPLFIVRLLVFWYRNQTMNVKWGSALSVSFTVHNGVKQGGILSPQFFCVYMDDLSVKLNSAGVGCHFAGLSYNHFSYADDMALVAPSPGGIQKLIKICEEYALDHDIVYNSKKSMCMLVHSKRVKFTEIPVITLCGETLKYKETVKYLGCMVSSDWCDDSDIDRQRRATVIRANSLMRKFYNCSEEVKLLLFNTFCSNMYCSHLWQSYKKATLNKLKVTYHNALRKLFGLQWDCSASNMFVSRHLTGFDALVRKYMAGFVNRLSTSQNPIMTTLVNSCWWHSPSSLGSHIANRLYSI